MLATTFHDRAALAVLGGATFGLALIAVIAHYTPEPLEKLEPPITYVVMEAIPPPPPANLDCTASVENVRVCADRLYRDYRADEAADLLWSVLRPWQVYGMTVVSSTRSDSPETDALALAALSSQYRLFHSFWEQGSDPDPREAYWPLAVARTIDREVGHGAHATAIWAKLINIAPRAANLYARGSSPEDCLNYDEPAAMARELGVPADPPNKHCMRVRIR